MVFTFPWRIYLPIKRYTWKNCFYGIHLCMYLTMTKCTWSGLRNAINLPVLSTTSCTDCLLVVCQTFDDIYILPMCAKIRSNQEHPPRNADQLSSRHHPEEYSILLFHFTTIINKLFINACWLGDYKQSWTIVVLTMNVGVWNERSYSNYQKENLK